MRINLEELPALVFFADETTPFDVINHKTFVAFDEKEHKVTATKIEFTYEGPRRIEYSFCFNPEYNEHTLETLRNWQKEKGK